MIVIDRLALVLPAELGERATALAELVAARLAEVPWPEDASIERLRLEHALDSLDAPDDVIANGIAVRLVDALGGAGGGDVARQQKEGG